MLFTRTTQIQKYSVHEIEDYFSREKTKWQINYDAEHTITLEYHTQTIEQCVNMIADASFRFWES